jgi:hypothetical protein
MNRDVISSELEACSMNRDVISSESNALLDHKCWSNKAQNSTCNRSFRCYFCCIIPY